MMREGESCKPDSHEMRWHASLLLCKYAPETSLARSWEVHVGGNPCVPVEAHFHHRMVGEFGSPIFVLWPRPPDLLRRGGRSGSIALRRGHIAAPPQVPCSTLPFATYAFVQSFAHSGVERVDVAGALQTLLQECNRGTLARRQNLQGAAAWKRPYAGVGPRQLHPLPFDAVRSVESSHLVLHVPSRLVFFADYIAQGLVPLDVKARDSPFHLRSCGGHLVVSVVAVVVGVFAFVAVVVVVAAAAGGTVVFVALQGKSGAEKLTWSSEGWKKDVKISGRIYR